MNTFDYKQKIFEFSDEIKRIIISKKQSQESEALLSLIHKMLFYAEQYFIELELKHRSQPEKITSIRNERQSVIRRLQNFANSVTSLDLELNQMVDFLNTWETKLTSQTV